MEDVGGGGRTVIFVSHDMAAVSRLCSRVILLEKGKVSKDGPTDQVVSHYLTSGYGTTASRSWQNEKEAPGGAYARLRGVRVRRQDGRVADVLDIRCPFTVEMEFDVLVGGELLMPIFAFNNEEGQRVFTTVDLDPDWRQCRRPEGRFTSTVHIPGNFLAEGMIFVNCVLVRTSRQDVQFRERSVVAFQIVDSLDGDSARGDWTKKFPGIVRPKLVWTTRFEPEETFTMMEKKEATL